MSYEIIAVLAIIVIGLVLFVTELVRVDVTSMIIMVLLMVSGVLTPEEGVSGFSNSATITVLALLILSAGLQNTGVVSLLGNNLLKIVGKSEVQIIVVMMISTGIISAFINNTAAIAVFIPIALKVAHARNISVSKLLIPLSFAAMLGGTCTLIGTSTNLLISEISKNSGYGSFSMFEFSQLGIVFLFSGILYMAFIGRFLIPARRKPEPVSKDYELKEYLTEMIILPDSPFIGQTLSQIQLDEKYNIEVLEVLREGVPWYLPLKRKTLNEGDILLVKGDVYKLLEVSGAVGISIKASQNIYDDWLKNEDLVLIEAIISPDSFLNGKTIRNARFRSRYNANTLAVRRDGETLQKKLRDITLRFGDSLLIECSKDRLDALQSTRDFIIISELEEKKFPKNKMIISVGIIVAVVALATFDVLNIMIGALAGVVVMFLTKCISIRKAYKEMDWQIFFLLAGIIPLGLALEKSGAATYLAQGILGITGSSGPFFMVALLYLTTTLVTEILSNNAAAVLLGPIALSMAKFMDINPKAMLFTILFAASTSFLTPIGYQTNTMIYGPGKYKYTDFFRSGALFNLFLWILSSFAITYYWID
ncbi:MAG: SLC13 family permease [Bacteroidetes bacterium]|nr:SLC13 family permease [Bacteroidota bacterium]HET6243312.1 SLC13 family permease [Bacteroidia bacterium]